MQFGSRTGLASEYRGECCASSRLFTELCLPAKETCYQVCIDFPLLQLFQIAKSAFLPTLSSVSVHSIKFVLKLVVYCEQSHSVLLIQSLVFAHVGHHALNFGRSWADFWAFGLFHEDFCHSTCVCGLGAVIKKVCAAFKWTGEVFS